MAKKKAVKAVKKPRKTAPTPLAARVAKAKAQVKQRAKASVQRMLEEDAKPEKAPRSARTARIPQRPPVPTTRRRGRQQVPAITPDDHPTIAELLGRGWTHRAIAEKYGVTRQAIGACIRQHIAPLLRDETRYHLSAYLNEVQEQRLFCWEQIRDLLATKKPLTAIMPEISSLMARVQRAMTLQQNALRYGINHQANDLVRPPTEDDFRIAGTDRVGAFLESMRLFVERAREVQGLKDNLTLGHERG